MIFLFRYVLQMQYPLFVKAAPAKRGKIKFAERSYMGSQKLSTIGHIAAQGEANFAASSVKKNIFTCNQVHLK